VSVDLAAELPARVSLAAVLERARDVLRALLGLHSEPPELAVIDGWRVENHSRVSSGRLLSPQELASTMIGERIPLVDGKTAGSVTFEVDLVGGKDRAYVMVIDLAGVQGMEPCIEAVVSPTRTCVGVVLATAIALGAASASGGEFVDVEIVMLDGVAWDPARFIELARLADGAGDFEARCEQFMRQFPGLNGWPKDRSAREA
jgi:hypothetical protein